MAIIFSWLVRFIGKYGWTIGTVGMIGMIGTVLRPKLIRHGYL